MFHDRLGRTSCNAPVKRTPVASTSVPVPIGQNGRKFRERHTLSLKFILHAYCDYLGEQSDQALGTRIKEIS